MKYNVIITTLVIFLLLSVAYICYQIFNVTVVNHAVLSIRNGLIIPREMSVQDSHHTATCYLTSTPVTDGVLVLRLDKGRWEGDTKYNLNILKEVKGITSVTQIRNNSLLLKVISDRNNINAIEYWFGGQDNTSAVINVIYSDNMTEEQIDNTILTISQADKVDYFTDYN